MASNTTARRKPAAAQKPKPIVGTATGLRQDRLSKKQMQSLYGYTARQLQVDPGLFDLFQRAFAGQWDKARFESEVEKLPWYRNNQASVRQYMLLSAEGGADFEAKKNQTFEFVRQQAMKIGKNLTNEQLWDLTEDTMMFGWGEQGKEFELQRAIVDLPGDGQYGGDIAANRDALRAVAHANNVRLDEQWYEAKAKSIAGGLSLPADAERAIRQMAADKAPAFAQNIMAGENLDALVSPWRRLMEDEWEISANSIPLDDPTLQEAIGRVGENGSITPMNLGEFAIRLRKDPRWLNTTKGQNSTTNAMSSVLRLFGMGN